MIETLRALDDDQAGGDDLEPVCRTSSVCSEVIESGEVIGHTLLLDYDDVDPSIPISDARDLEGWCAVLRSSPSCYHLWDLRVSSWIETVRRARETAADDAFLEEMSRRRQWVIRTEPRFREADLEVMVTAPVPVVLDPGEGVLSDPHAAVLERLSRQAGRDVLEAGLEGAREGLETAGEGIVRTHRLLVPRRLREGSEGGAHA